MVGNSIDDHRNCRIGKYLEGVAGLQRVFAAACAGGVLPGWDRVVAERIIHPFDNFMAQRRDVGHIAPKDAGPNPTRPGKSLHQLFVAACTCVKGGMEAEDAAFLHVGARRQEYVVGQGNGQGIDLQVFQLNDGVELRDEKADIDNCEDLTVGAAPEKGRRPFGNVERDGWKWTWFINQRMPVKI